MFRSVFPIEDFNKTASLDFVKYEIGDPKYDVDECISKGLTYETPIRITVRLVVFDVDEETDNRTIRDIKEQDIYFGTLPLMTEKGTYVINGTERVIVNQLQRSPGIIFEHDSGKSHSSRKVLYSSRIIPMRGSWLDFDFDHKDILYVRIDRRRKMPATILLKAMGLSRTDILDYFYDTETYNILKTKVQRHVVEDQYRKEPAFAEIKVGEKVVTKKGASITKGAWRKLVRAEVKTIDVDPESLIGLYLAVDLVDKNGEVVAEAAEEVTVELLEKVRDAGIRNSKCCTLAAWTFPTLCATRCCSTRPRIWKPRRSRSTAVSVRVPRPRPRSPRTSSRISSAVPTTTISPALDATNSIPA